MENFVASQVTQRGLDERTAKAYELDLQHLYRWMEEKQIRSLDKTAAEAYLNYLLNEKKLKASTVMRKYRVLQYYLEYLYRQSELAGDYAISAPKTSVEKPKEGHLLSKAEVDAFFSALEQEYESLEEGFRKRVCLRDRVMMELLFYHGMEISELLRMKLEDYNRKTGLLLIPGKREKLRQEYLFSRELKEKMNLWLDEHRYFERGNGYDQYLFLSKVGRPPSMKMVINIFNKYRVLAGIEKEYTPKDLKCSLKKYARELLVERCS